MERDRRAGEEAAAHHQARAALSTVALRSERLDLEPVSPAHADEMVDLLADRALYAWYDDEASPTLDELRVRYARQAGGISPDGREVWHTWILRDRATRTPIGFAQATVTTDDEGVGAAELAWVVGTAWQHQGYASEAATAIRDGVLGPGSLTGDDVSRVIAHIAPGHGASEAVARHLGLTPTDVSYEGEIRWELLTASV